MTEDKKHHTSSKTDIRLDTSLREWVLSGIAGVTSGLVAAGAAIRREFNEEVKKWPGLNTYKVTDKASVLKAQEKGRNVTLTLEETATSPAEYKIKGMLAEHEEKLIALDKQYLRHDTASWAEHQMKNSALKRNYAANKNEFLESAYGIHSKGLRGLFKGTYQRHGFLGDSTKATIAFAGISTAIIVGVTTLGLFNGVATRNKTKKIEDALDQLLEQHNQQNQR